MTLIDAYKMVFEDLQNIPWCRGEYDTKNGNEHFMYGISTIMEIIADRGGLDSDAVSDNFVKNMRE